MLGPATTHGVFISRTHSPLPYLDVEAYYNNGWQTRIYSKPIDVHAYLDPTSCNAKHVHRNIPKGVALRTRRLCSEISEYDKAAHSFCHTHFRKRGYSISMTTSDFTQVRQMDRQTLLRRKAKTRLPQGAIPFSFPYSQSSASVAKELRNLHSVLHANPETRKVFPRPQMAAFQHGLSMKDVLCRAALNRPPQLPWGCFHCPSGRCSLHPFLKEVVGIRSTTTDEWIHIRKHLTRQSPSDIYVITCTRCSLQGAG